MARLVVGAVGAYVGFLIGGPAGAVQGFALAYGATGFLDPNKKLLGPKLNDLKAPSASYGAPIAYLEGSPRVAGNYIWSSDKRAIANTTTTGGKGGPGVDSTTFTYEMDVFVLLAINRCAAIRRIWSNGKLIWSVAAGVDGSTLQASESVTNWRDIRFYDGAPDQLPDPTYEADVGVGNAPAYRTRATVMIEGLNLGGSGQIPVLTFEVLSEADSGKETVELGHVPVPYAPAAGVTAFSLTAPFDVLAGTDVDTGSGHLYSYAAWTVDPATGAATQTGSFDIGQHSHVAMRGQSDESVLVAYAQGASPAGTYDIYTASGGAVQLDITAVNNTELRFAKVGDDFVTCAHLSSAGDFKLRRFSRSGGGLPVVTASVDLPFSGAPTFGCDSVAIGGAYVYALDYDGTTLFKSDLATLTLVETIAIPPEFLATFGHVICDGDTPYVIGTGGSSVGGTIFANPLVRWNGATWDLVAYASKSGAAYVPTPPDPTPTLSDLYRGSLTYGTMNFVDGVLFSQDPPAVTLTLRYLGMTVGLSPPTLDQVVRRLCLRTKILTDADIDVTDLSHDVAIADGLVRSMAISQVSNARASIETLATGYLFDAYEDDKLYFVRRGAASALTIPFADLAAGPDDKGEPLPISRANDIEVAARVSVKFANTDNDSQDGLEAADRLVTGSTSEQVIELPLGFKPDEAKKIADANTLDLAVQQFRPGPITVTRKYAAVQPTDVITVVDRLGSEFRVRVAKSTLGQGTVTLELTLDDAAVINSAASTNTDYVDSTAVQSLSASVLQMLDIPILRDADNALGPYAAVAVGGTRWAGAQIDKSSDDTTFANVGAVTAATQIGRATTVLGNFTGGNVFDDVHTVTVDVGEDATLSSYSRDTALAGAAPGYLIGSEIIVALTATFVSPGVYTLSRLLRGRRGTEWAMGSHAVGDLVVVLQQDGLRKVTDVSSDRNAVRYYRATTIGRSFAPAAPFTDTGVALKPFSPVDVRVDTYYTVTWQRRSRLASVFLADVAVPLGEASESYDVEVLDTLSEVVETATVSEPTYTITTAGDLTGYSVIVYQNSAEVGRGYPSIAVVIAAAPTAPLVPTTTTDVDILQTQVFGG